MSVKDPKIKECKKLSVPECKEREPECMINKKDKCQKQPRPKEDKSEERPKLVAPRKSKNQKIEYSGYFESRRLNHNS